MTATTAVSAGASAGTALDPLTPKDKLEYAWQYFALHAAQRISVFNFFLVLFGIATAGLAGCIQAGGRLLPVGVFIGGALATLSLTFWKLDERTAFLVKHAEESLKSLERLCMEEGQRLFLREIERTRDNQSLFSGIFRVWTYSSCFGLVFLFAAFAGIFGACLSLTFLWDKGS